MLQIAEITHTSPLHTPYVIQHHLASPQPNLEHLKTSPERIQPHTTNLAVSPACPHQHLDKFSDELKKPESLRSDIFRHFQTFSDILRHSQTSSLSVTQKLPGLISVHQLHRLSAHQLHRLSVHLRYFQTSRFPYIQIVRTSQLFSVQQFSSYTGHKNLSVNTSPAVVQQASISDYQLFSDRIPDIFRPSEIFRITVCQIIRTSVFFSDSQCTSFSDS